MHILKRLHNLWRLSAYKLADEDKPKLNPYLVKDDFHSEKVRPATIVELDKPDLFA